MRASKIKQMYLLFCNWCNSDREFRLHDEIGIVDNITQDIKWEFFTDSQRQIVSLLLLNKYDYLLSMFLSFKDGIRNGTIVHPKKTANKHASETNNVEDDDDYVDKPSRYQLRLLRLVMHYYFLHLLIGGDDIKLNPDMRK